MVPEGGRRSATDFLQADQGIILTNRPNPLSGKDRKKRQMEPIVRESVMFELRKPEILPINDHVWLLDDHGEATCYVVAGTEQAMVIDTSIGLCNIREEAASLTPLPLICVNTHGHEDHMGGNWSFDKAYMNLTDLPLAEEFIREPEVQEGMKQNGIRFPAFEHIEDGQVFDLGGLQIEAIYLPGHTAGEIVLLDRQDRILFSGDGILEHLWLQLPESLPIRTQIESMKKLQTMRDAFDTILHGHCQAPFGAELFDTLLKALEDLEAGSTADDVDYPWLGNVSKAHPYQPNDRRIVYKS